MIFMSQLRLMCISYNFLSFFYLLFLSLSRLNCRQHPCFMDNFIVFLISRARIFRMHWVCVCMYLEPFSSGLSLEYKGSINGKSNFQIQDVMSILRGRPISSFLMSFALFFGFFLWVWVNDLCTLKIRNNFTFMTPLSATTTDCCCCCCFCYVIIIS